MTSNEIENAIDYWEARKYQGMWIVEEAEDNISELLREVPDEEDDEF